LLKIAQKYWPLAPLAIAVVAVFLLLISPVGANCQRYNTKTQHQAFADCIQDASAESVAEYTKVLAALTLILAVVGAVQMLYLVRADDTAAKAAEAALKGARTAEDSLRAANRPWLVLSEMDVRTLRFTESGGLVAEIRPTVRNIGPFPATNVRFEYALVDIPRQPDGELGAMRYRMAAVGQGFPGEVIFPGTRHNLGWNIVTLDALVAPNNGNGTGKVNLFLVGCISYEFALSDKLHQTPFSGHIWGPEGMIEIGVSLGDGQVSYEGGAMITGHRPT
jgi:hypothetical protein